MYEFCNICSIFCLFKAFINAYFIFSRIIGLSAPWEYGEVSYTAIILWSLKAGWISVRLECILDNSGAVNQNGCHKYSSVVSLGMPWLRIFHSFLLPLWLHYELCRAYLLNLPLSPFSLLSLSSLTSFSSLTNSARLNCSLMDCLLNR